jgi:ubiquinone/menaquinone biosynthesis C-methylase UbiE
MHRSGTSALTGVLSLLGIHPGDNLLPAMKDVNPKGFWEHAEIVSIHDRLLASLNSSWDDETPLPDQWWLLPVVAPFRDKIIGILRRDFGAPPIWLIKDPRMCRLLPMWLNILQGLNCHPLFVIALRHPVEVARSLLKRDGITEEASCLLWLTHMLEAEYLTRGQPRVFVTYENLLTDWRKTVSNIIETLPLPCPLALETVAPEINAFLDPALRHHTDSTILPNHPVYGLAQTGFDLLSVRDCDIAELDRLRSQVQAFVINVTPWAKVIHLQKKTNQELQAEISQKTTLFDVERTVLNTEIKRIKSTFSWQITKPLRLIANLPRILFSKKNFRHSPIESPSLPDEPNEQDARALLLQHFSPIYKDRATSYVDELLATDHYRYRLDYLQSVIGSQHFCGETPVLISGYGAGSEMIAARQAGLGDIYGVEVENIWLSATKKRLKKTPRMYPSHYDGQTLPYPDAKFDIVISGHVIEHSHDPQTYLHECFRVLKCGGYLSLEFPSRYHHTELHTRLPSLEWLPKILRNSIIKILSSRISPLSKQAKEKYHSIVATNLHQISMYRIRAWMKSSKHPWTILNITKAAPGIVRCVIRKDAATH